ncbi:hypothetical protein PoB_005813900 [Plakobranchus ocellatus]|uniref:Uncharacterized protein n=1 Tax=Plakobranchus ocellatus TaxID=259542 RepID=A0AAV4CKZ5_9GAST|nr:hypothetical protein PoB_005813900 [Plakobranchus ocellatus]
MKFKRRFSLKRSDLGVTTCGQLSIGSATYWTDVAVHWSSKINLDGSFFLAKMQFMKHGLYQGSFSSYCAIAPLPPPPPHTPHPTLLIKLTIVISPNCESHRSESKKQQEALFKISDLFS